MEPGIWSNLPKELLELVFTRLPVAHILRLRVLSQEWNWNVTAPESAFRKACSAIQCKFFGLVYEGDDWGMVTLQIYNTRSGTWHTVEIVGRFPESPLATMGATDGGLVCWIERLTNKKKTPLWIMVCNPLTRAFRTLQLPSGALRSAQPSMVQLVVDGVGSKDYKVIAVGPTRRHGGVVYHAASDTWTSTESLPGCVFGEEYEWGLTEEEDEENGVYCDVYETVAVAPCAFDCASSQLLDLRDDDSYPCARPSFVEYARVKDRLFVLLNGSTDQQRLGPFTVAEYQARRRSLHWVKVGKYRCLINLDVFSGAPDHSLLRLYACEGFLLIPATLRFSWDNVDNVVPRVAQFYDFCTRKWEDIPGVPENDHIMEEGTMCELRLDAFP